MSVEYFFPNDDDPRKDKQPNEFVEINAYLEAKTNLDEELPTIQGIAEKMGITDLSLRTWLHFDEEFKEGLTQLKDWMDKGLETNDPAENRADVLLTKFLLNETRNRHEEEMGKVE